MLIGRIIRELLLGPAYFWHKYLIKKSYSLNYDKIRTYEKSNEMEITTKEEIRESPNRYLRKSLFVPLKRCRTGGTTGTPLVFYHNYFMTRQKERAYIFDIWKAVGYKPFDYRIIVRGNSNSRIYYSWFENALIIPQNCINEANRKELETKFSYSKGFYLHVYPSTLKIIINFFGDTLFKTFKIKGVLAGSESFPIFQMEYYETYYGLAFAHWYGHSEYAILARYCSVCKEFHFYPTYGTAALLGSGKEKQILATSHNYYGTIFHNYLTEDLAIDSETECPIDNFPKVKTIIGRKEEYFIDKCGEWKAFGPYLFGIHSKFWEMIISIQFTQNAVGVLHVRYVPSNSFSKNEFYEFLNLRFSQLELEFEEVHFIEGTKRGKHKYFIQNLEITDKWNN